MLVNPRSLRLRGRHRHRDVADNAFHRELWTRRLTGAKPPSEHERECTKHPARGMRAIGQPAVQPDPNLSKVMLAPDHGSTLHITYGPVPPAIGRPGHPSNDIWKVPAHRLLFGQRIRGDMHVKLTTKVCAQAWAFRPQLFSGRRTKHETHPPTAWPCLQRPPSLFAVTALGTETAQLGTYQQQ